MIQPTALAISTPFNDTSDSHHIIEVPRRAPIQSRDNLHRAIRTANETPVYPAGVRVTSSDGYTFPTYVSCDGQHKMMI